MPKANKKPKDLNAPKRPQSGFFLFANSRRSEFKQQGNEQKVTEISKIIADEWKHIDDNAKKKWTDQAKDLKVKYKENLDKYKKTAEYKKHLAEVAKWKESKNNNNENDDNEEDNEDDDDDDENDDNKKKTNRPKKPKDPKAPKRSPSGYFLFQNERREQIRKQYPSKKMKEIVQMVGAEWQAMSEADKKPFEAKAAEKKQQYQTEMENYKKSDNFKAHQKNLHQWKLKCAELKKRGSGNKKANVTKTSSNAKSNNKNEDDDENDNEGSEESDADNNDNENDNDNDNDSSEEESDGNKNNKNNNNNNANNNNNENQDEENESDEHSSS